MYKLSGLRNGGEERLGRIEGREGDGGGGTVGKCSRDVHGITASVSTGSLNLISTLTPTLFSTLK